MQNTDVMAENKKGFILYCDLIHTLEQLPNEKAGELFKHILRYVNDLNPQTDDLVTKISFEPIKQQLKRDLVKWKSTSTTRSTSGREGGIKSGEARRIKSEQNKANEANASNVKQNEQVTVTVTDTVIVKEKKEKRVNVFTPPTQQEVVDYFRENGYTEKAGIKAFNYYNVADWIDSKGSKVKNWKQKMQSVWFKDENKENDNRIDFWDLQEQRKNKGRTLE